MAWNPHESKTHAHIESAGEAALLARAFTETERLLRIHQINMEDFRGKYGADKIAEDMAYVEQKKHEFEATATDKSRESQRLATIFEGIFHAGAGYGWLGDPKTVRVVKTSSLDDFKHGVDGIVEFTEEGRGTEHLSIGVDVTYSDSLKNKFEKIKSDIEQGRLSPIEYFRSGNFTGSLENVPRVIVGAERRNLIELCREVFVKKDKERLERHPFQVLQLKQMRLQLDAFAEFANSFGRRDIAALYSRDAEIIRKILQQKRLTEEIRMGELEHDRVFIAIKKELENLK